MKAAPTKRRRVATLPTFDRDLLRAAQYAYYVKHHPIMTDMEFDQLEESYLASDPTAKMPIGSDRPGDYDEASRALCMYFLFRYNPRPPAGGDTDVKSARIDRGRNTTGLFPFELL